MKWRRWSTFVIACVLSCCLSLYLDVLLSAHSQATSAYNWNIPTWMPKPVVPSNNPMTREKVELGRHLFYEKRLSITKEFSCASCHIQAKAFSDDKTVAIGATGEKHPRNSMSLTNIAYNSVLTWANPLMKSLETQLLVPLFGEHPVEMGMVGREQEILTMLREDVKYRQLFIDAFGSGEDAISIANLASSIALL